MPIGSLSYVSLKFRPEWSTLSKAYTESSFLWDPPSLPKEYSCSLKMLIWRPLLKIAMRHKRHLKNVWQPLTAHMLCDDKSGRSLCGSLQRAVCLATCPNFLGLLVYSWVCVRFYPLFLFQYAVFVSLIQEPSQDIDHFKNNLQFSERCIKLFVLINDCGLWKSHFVWFKVIND